MKKTSLTICLAFAFLVTAAVAQTPRGQQTTPSSPGMGQAGQQPGYPGQQPGSTENPGMSQPQTDQTANPNQTRNEKGEKSEKRLKGCVQSQAGQYVLETKKGKTVPLTGQDVSAHAGHEVAVKGSWESGAGTAVSSGAGGKTSEKTFNVASVEMISDTCGGKGKGSSGSMGTAPSSTAPSGNEPPSQQPPTSQPPQNQPPQ
jgi:hypothetical protein